ncbi:MAG: 2-C-methyl-D-erythritol 4-phosphate cytidylyltransferase [Candidatus Nanopelagicales bacterium]
MTALVIVAAGSGQRLGAGIPKALVSVAGDSLLGHCLRTAAAVTRLSQTVVVAPADRATDVRTSIAGRYPTVTVVPGAATRDASVRAGLATVADTRVLIHDAARPFAPAEVFDRVLDALEQGAEAVVPALAVSDTIKQVHAGFVTKTLVREELMAVQTPQGFLVEELLQAHAARSGDVTDDAMLLEQAGVPVQVVAGSHHGFKITTGFDLRLAEAMHGRP